MHFMKNVSALNNYLTFFDNLPISLLLRVISAPPSSMFVSISWLKDAFSRSRLISGFMTILFDFLLDDVPSAWCAFIDVVV